MPINSERQEEDPAFITLSRAPDETAANRIKRFNFWRQASIENLFDVLLVFVIGGIIIARTSGFNIDDPVLLFAAIFMIKALVAKGADAPPALKFNLIDISVLLVLISEMVNYFASTYPDNSFHYLQEIIFLQLFYWLVRLNLRYDYQMVGVFLSLAALGLYLSVRMIGQFSTQLRQMRSLGFSDVSDLRNLFHLMNPPGSPLGEWITILLVMLPFPLLLLVRFRNIEAATWLLAGSALLILIAITITFSRGLYLATLIFFIVSNILFYIYRIFPIRRLLIYDCSAALILVLVVWLSSLSAPLINTLLLFRTTSQVRSFEGRVGIWKTSFEMFKDHPWLGVGSYNFPMHYVLYKESEAEFVGRAFNIFIQLLVEKGVLGLLSYGLLLCALLREAVRKILIFKGHPFRRAIVVIYLATFISVLARDLGYSSILTSGAVSLLLWFMLAHMAALREEGVNCR